MSHLFEVTVKEYLPHPNDYHKCVDKIGGIHRFDLFVAGEMPEGETNESIVGRKILIKWASPYLLIANSLELLPK